MTESQARPLTPLTPEAQVEAWQRVVESAGERTITAALVERVVAEMKAEAAAQERRPEPSRPSTPNTPSVAAAPQSLFETEPEAESDEAPHVATDLEEDDEPLLVVQEYRTDRLEIADLYIVDAWHALPDADRRWIVQNAPVGHNTKFTRTNDNVEWALWTWNPVTGCDHGCNYCYARDIAERFYTELPEGERFAPVFRPGRLHAPRHMRVPAAAAHNIGEKNVFTGSMTDLFGKWVPQEWIDAVFQEVVRAAEWNFLFLTKFPQRLAEQIWPENAWVGTTVDRQARVATAERSFRGVKAGVKWLSCEPMMERLTFTSLEMFDWVVIGAASKSTQTPEFQPPWEWVEHLMTQARAAGCRVYIKPNLRSRPQEYPGEVIR